MATNNMMEVMAIVELLKMTDVGTTISITSDSQYAIRSLTDWAIGWEALNWKTRSGKRVKMQSLFKLGLELIRERTVTFQWVPSHSGNKYNDMVDALAGVAMDDLIKNDNPSKTVTYPSKEYA